MFKKINKTSLSIFHHDSKIPAKHSLFSHKPVFINSTKRNYYADTVEKTPIIPTKIISQQGHVRLHLYKQFYPYNQPVIESTPDITAQEWQPFLSLSSDGIIYNYVYQENSYEMEMVVSTGKKAPCDDLGANILTDWKERNTLLHILYRISQEQWEDFIAKLPDQQVAHYLKLKQHRHLLWAYNYVTEKTGKSRLDRAKWIGEYHFLMADMMYTPPFSKAIEEGNFNFLKGPYSCYTPNFIRKMAHCPVSIYIWWIGGKLIRPASMGANGYTDRKKLEDNINKLPSSQLEPEKFKKLLKFSLTASDPFNSILFFNNQANSKNTYPVLEPAEMALVKDYLDDVFRYLIFPGIWRFEKKFNRVKIENMSDNLLDIHKSNLFSSCQKEYWFFLNNKISAATLFQLQERWHRNLGIINAVKPSLDLPEEWPALFEKITIDNVTFETLISIQQLKQEGDEMHHCVGAYAMACNTRKSHIIKVVSLDNEHTTMELTFHETKPIKFFIKQHFGIANCLKIPRQIEQAAKKLIERLNNGDITHNPVACEIQTVPSKIEPFPFDNMELQEEIFQTYLTTKILPHHMRGKTYSDMLEKSGLVEFVKQVLNIATPKLPVKKTKKLLADRSLQVTERLNPTDDLSSPKEQPQQASSTNKHGFFDSSYLSDKRFCRSNKPNMLYEVSSIIEISDSALRDYGFDPEQCIRRQIGIDNFIDIYASKELAAQARLLLKTEHFNLLVFN